MHVETQFHTFADKTDPFRLRSGQTLDSVTLAYETYGELNEEKSNAILLFHALSGSQHAAGFNPAVPGLEDLWTKECKTGWWDDFVGPGKALDTDKFFVVCANYIGGCYGSSGPSSNDPATGKVYGGSFPNVCMADIVDSQVELLNHLGIDCLHAVIGASLAGMLCLSLATRHPDRVRLVIPISTSMRSSILQRIHNFEQIYAIERDPNFRGGDYYDGIHPDEGLTLARIISHKTFVSLGTMKHRARDEIRQPEDDLSFYHVNFPVESYVLHQGKKFVRRFDANTYLRILEAWQKYDVAQEAGVGSYIEAFVPCRHQRYMVFSIDSDVCFYPDEQESLAATLDAAGVPSRRITVHSDKGHDAFLLEAKLFTPHLAYTLENSW